MEFYDYFQSYNDYFWQWEDNAEAIAIPNHNTIAYRDFVIHIFDKLAPQGIPPFGALLLAITATNPNGYASIEVIRHIISKSLNTTDDLILAEAVSFLKILSRVPEQYKTGNKRLLLLQSIFENCHNIISIKGSRRIINDYHNNKHHAADLATKKDFNNNNYNRDFRVISLLKSKYEDEHAIIEKIAGLPEVSEKLLLDEENTSEENTQKDFIQELTDNSKTFYVGALIKQIWGGINIPAHSSKPSEQPIGGISDLSNKGDLNRLLLSEFANEDLVFLSRLANNEALYIQREIPPDNNNQHRIILIDLSLKNWGTPKTIAFAIMLAIAKHPKTNIQCHAFALGNAYYPISIENTEGIIEGLQLLDGSLHAANGLNQYLKDATPQKNTELIFITSTSALREPALLKALNDHQSAINYWIHTDADGSIDIYRKQQKSKKHIQHILLPLEELWTKLPKAAEPIKIPVDEISCPILFRLPRNAKKIISATDGEVFQLTPEKTVLRLYNRYGDPHSKGWEMIYEKLPLITEQIEMGLSDTGEYILLILNQNKKEIVLVNLSTGNENYVSINGWKANDSNGFIFQHQKFYHISINGCWAIDLEGNITSEKSIDYKIVFDRQQELKQLTTKYNSSASVLKNVHVVFVNEQNNLAVNVHEFSLVKNTYIKLEKRFSQIRQHEAIKDDNNNFVFNDGSYVQINRSGMMILHSSDTSIPSIYIPLVLDAALGIATRDEFTGNEYYYKERLFEVILKDSYRNSAVVENIIKQKVGVTALEYKNIASGKVKTIALNFNKTTANEIKTLLQKNRIYAEVKQIVDQHTPIKELTRVISKSFFKKHIAAFINQIQTHGAQH
jgi:hypothetical protein